jgi:hypothetical protein
LKKKHLAHTEMGCSSSKSTAVASNDAPAAAAPAASAAESAPAPTANYVVISRFNVNSDESLVQIRATLDGPDGLAKTRQQPGFIDSVEETSADKPLQIVVRTTWASKENHQAYMDMRMAWGMMEKFAPLLDTTTPFEMTPVASAASEAAPVEAAAAPAIEAAPTDATPAPEAAAAPAAPAAEETATETPAPAAVEETPAPAAVEETPAPDAPPAEEAAKDA